MSEKWKNIQGYGDTYQISSNGDVLSFARYSGGKLLTPYFDKDGYVIVTLSKNGLTRHHKVHQLVLAAFSDTARQSNETVHHLDSDRSNNNIENLIYLDRGENVRTGIQGENHYKAKLSEDDVLGIIALLNEGFSGSRIAKHYNVPPQLISNIKNNRTWKHLKR